MLEKKPDALGTRGVDELRERLEAFARDGSTRIALRESLAHVAHPLVRHRTSLFAPAHLQGARILGGHPGIGTAQHVDEGLEGRVVACPHDRLECGERGTQARARTGHGKLCGKGNARACKRVVQTRICIGGARAADEHVRVFDTVFLVHGTRETGGHVSHDMQTVGLAHMHVTPCPDTALAREEMSSQGKKLVIFRQDVRIDVESLPDDGNRRTRFDSGEKAARMRAVQIGGLEDQLHAPANTVLRERVLGLGELDEPLMLELRLVERDELHDP